MYFNYIYTHTHTYVQHYYVRPARLPQREGGHCGRHRRMWRSGYGEKFVLCARVSACALRLRVRAQAKSVCVCVCHSVWLVYLDHHISSSSLFITKLIELCADANAGV